MIKLTHSVTVVLIIVPCQAMKEQRTLQMMKVSLPKITKHASLTFTVIQMETPWYIFRSSTIHYCPMRQVIREISSLAALKLPIIWFVRAQSTRLRLPPLVLKRIMCRPENLQSESRRSSSASVRKIVSNSTYWAMFRRISGQASCSVVSLIGSRALKFSRIRLTIAMNTVANGSKLFIIWTGIWSSIDWISLARLSSNSFAK